MSEVFRVAIPFLVGLFIVDTGLFNSWRSLILNRPRKSRPCLEKEAEEVWRMGHGHSVDRRSAHAHFLGTGG